MFYEIKIAQSFVLSLLYNKLPRRRVNLFGDALESAMRDKFADHWYPDMPFKGSAYRCLKLTDPSDLVLIRAAMESGNPISNIIENLPADLAIWIDPGEVSFRIGEKGSVKLLYTSDTKNKAFAEKNGLLATIQDQLPTHHGALGQLGVDIPPATPTRGVGSPTLSIDTNDLMPNPMEESPGKDHNPDRTLLPAENLNSIFSNMSINCDTSSNSTPAGFSMFVPRPQQPVTYTAGTFAQTKFGSTKLKTNGKKANRMSPTEFSNYIKQRAMQKQSSSINQVLMGNMTTSSSNQRNGYRNQRQFHNLNNCSKSNQIGENYFYPILPERNTSINEISVSSFYSGGMNGGSLPSAGPPFASPVSSHQWGYQEQEGDSLAQDFYYMPTNKPGYRGMTMESDLFSCGPYNPSSYNDSFSTYNGGFETGLNREDFNNSSKISSKTSGHSKDITSASPTLAPRVLVAN